MLLGKAKPYQATINTACLLLFVGSLWAFFDLGWLWRNDFHYIDDYRSYFAIIKQVIDASGLSADPYNDGNVISGLGLQNVWLAAWVHTFGWQASSLADPALPLLISAILIILLVQKSKNIASQLWLLLLGFLTVFNAPYFGSTLLAVNASATYTILPIWLGLGLWANSKMKYLWLDVLIGGLLVAASLALKNSIVPFSLIIGTIFLLHKFKKNYLSYLLIAGFSALFLSPLLLYNYQSFNTLWYPFLGKGIHISSIIPDSELRHGNSVLGLFVAAFKELLNETYVYLFALVILFQLRYFSWKSTLVLSIIPCLNFLLIAYGTMGSFSYRYAALPFLFTLFIQPILTLSNNQNVPLKKFDFTLLILPFLFLIPQIYLWQSRPRMMGHPTFEQRLAPQQQQYATLAQHLPSNGKQLIWVNHPYLLPLHQKPHARYVWHNPSYSSPAPHLALVKDTTQLLAHFAQNNIRYLVYQHEAHNGWDNALFHPTKPEHSAWQYQGPWVFDIFQRTKLMIGLVEQLAASKKAIYQDSHFIILDLQPQGL